MRLILIATASCILSLSASDAQAHDFWLKPNTFQTEQAPVQIPVKFLVGHADDVTPWSLSWDRVVALRSYSLNEYQDQIGNIVVNNQLVSGFANVKLGTVGSHVVGFESYHSFSSLDAEKFNEYAQKEGLSLVLNERRRLNKTNQNGREIYSRKAKTIIQVGGIYSENVTRPIGHMLEIVPLQHPYRLNEDGDLPVKVLFRGKPLENALIDIASLDKTTSQKQEMRTNKNGEASFTITPEGSWIVNVIWSVPNQNNLAEFETYFSSLTFGY